MIFFSTTMGRTLLVLTFLICVNLGSGYAAVHLGYPSVWGNSTGIFMEYVVPLLYNWALAHLVFMVPIAIALSLVPGWDARSVFIFRAILGFVFIAALLFEVRLPVGRLNHNPFLLFILMDTGVALLLTVIFYPPFKAILGLTVASIIIVTGLFLYANPKLFESPPTSNRAVDETRNTSQSQAESTSFFESITTFERHNYTEVNVTVREVVGPNLGPIPSDICLNAKPLATEPRMVVKFMVYPWFENEEKYIYPAGEAGLDAQGIWYCEFVYPSQVVTP